MTRGDPLRDDVPIGLSIAALRRVVAGLLRAAKLDAPEIEARMLVGDVLDLDHTGLATNAERIVDARETQRLRIHVARRLAREPVARILGRREFWSLDLEVSPATLVPRPDTETLVEAVLGTIDRSGGRARPWRIADLGTGTGAIVIALTSELASACGVGTDVSHEALTVARRNAVRHRVASRIDFVACDLGSALANGFDVVVSNPPYVRTGDIEHLAPEVRDHEPRLALDGGSDGLAAYRVIADDAVRLITPGGVVAVEVGIGQATPVADLFARAGLVRCAVHHDLAGIARVLVAGRAP